MGVIIYSCLSYYIIARQSCKQKSGVEEYRSYRSKGGGKADESQQNLFKAESRRVE